jgi:hypothetical protein
MLSWGNESTGVPAFYFSRQRALALASCTQSRNLMQHTLPGQSTLRSAKSSAAEHPGSVEEKTTASPRGAGSYNRNTQRPAVVIEEARPGTAIERTHRRDC